MKKSVLNYQKIASFLRYWILKMTTQAGSGHPTSSLSATDLMAVLWADFFRYDFQNPDNPANDRLIFSKGHATPLYYALFALSGAIKVEELSTYRQFGSRLEGHPTLRFPFVEAATGSLGQGLSVGVGLALALKAKIQNGESQRQDSGKKFKKSLQLTTYNLPPYVYVLLGDGELAEGSVWEAVSIASKYKLNNLIAILDINRLGQSEETMLGWKIKDYQKRFESFGWEVQVIDGHNYQQIKEAFSRFTAWKKSEENLTPKAIIAKTVKGKGISFLEDKSGWHGKPLPQDLLEKALKELGEVDLKLRIKVKKPPVLPPFSFKSPKSLKSLELKYKKGEEVATRKAYGTALARLGEYYPQIVALDGDVKNSTYSEIFKEKFPDRFYEMYIAEQNMVSAAVGFSRMGFIPFVSTFGAFFTRAFDQIRMAAISGANIKFCGSHAGVSIGEDGPSQMGLEDIAMFRAIHHSLVLYPSDAASCEKLVYEMAKHRGIAYLRTTRPPTPVIYDNEEEFPIGGCKIHRLPNSLKLLKKKIIIIAAGITLFEALQAQEKLAKEGVEVIVVDCYSIKPIDEKTLRTLGQSAAFVLTVEDHWFEGGLGDAVLNVFAHDSKVRVYKLAVSKMPMSGKPSELFAYEGISAEKITNKVKKIIFKK